MKSGTDGRAKGENDLALKGNGRREGTEGKGHHFNGNGEMEGNERGPPPSLKERRTNLSSTRGLKEVSKKERLLICGSGMKELSLHSDGKPNLDNMIVGQASAFPWRRERLCQRWSSTSIDGEESAVVVSIPLSPFPP